MSVTIYLANKGFSLPVGRLDSARRKAYFANPADPKSQLVPEEIEILTALGINLGEPKALEALKPYLAQFFDQLPQCQSDSSVILSKECEVVHHVLWTTLFNARNRSDIAHKLNWEKKKPLADLSTAINDSVLNDLQPRREDVNDIDRLFTLLLKGAEVPAVAAVAVPAASQTFDVNKLFTLILPNAEPGDGESTASGPSTISSVSQPPADGFIRPPIIKNVPTGPTQAPQPKSSWFTRRKKTPFTPQGTQVAFNAPARAPNRPSWFTRKFGKKPLSSQPRGQIPLTGETDEFQQKNPMLAQQAPSANHPGESPFTQRATQVNMNGPERPTPSGEEPANHPGESPFTRQPGQVPFANETEEFQQENPMLARRPSINQEGKSPFTAGPRQVPIGGPERGPPLNVIPTEDDIKNQCEGKPRPTERELNIEEFKRSLYFFYSVKTQTDVYLHIPALAPEVESKFIGDWQKAIKGDRNKLTASLKFLGVPADKLIELNDLYKIFINGGERPSPILAFNCNKIGETAAVFLERLYPTIERTPSQRMYLFQHADWPAGTGSDITLETPKTVNNVDISIRDKSRNDYFVSEGMHHLTILTTQDIDYSENFEFDYNIQGRHITDYLLMRDLFAKNKNYVLDISPQLIHLFYKERNLPRPTPDGQTTTINDTFFKNAFGGNHIPPQLSNDPPVQEQVDMAYYAICNAITYGDAKPYKFYSKPTSSKLHDIIEWLENATPKQYQTIKNLMGWAVSAKPPIEQKALLDLFKSVAKKPESFFNKMFTRKNKKNKTNAATRKNKARNEAAEVEALEKAQAQAQAPAQPAQPAQMPPTTIRPLPNTRGILPIESARQQQAPQRLLLEAPAVPKKGKRGMNNKTQKILARAQPRPGSVAATLGIPPTRSYELSQSQPQSQSQQQPKAVKPRPGSVAAKVAAEHDILGQAQQELRNLREAEPPPNVNEPPLILEEPSSKKPGFLQRLFGEKSPKPLPLGEPDINYLEEASAPPVSKSTSAIAKLEEAKKRKEADITTLKQQIQEKKDAAKALGVKGNRKEALKALAEMKTLNKKLAIANGFLNKFNQTILALRGHASRTLNIGTTAASSSPSVRQTVAEAPDNSNNESPPPSFTDAELRELDPEEAELDNYVDKLNLEKEENLLKGSNELKNSIKLTELNGDKEEKRAAAIRQKIRQKQGMRELNMLSGEKKRSRKVRKTPRLNTRRK